jgi:hypothetical protein
MNIEELIDEDSLCSKKLKPSACIDELDEVQEVALGHPISTADYIYELSREVERKRSFLMRVH